MSLTLRKDLLRLFPILVADDVEFALHWIEALQHNNYKFAEKIGISRDEISILEEMIIDKKEL